MSHNKIRYTTAAANYLYHRYGVQMNGDSQVANRFHFEMGPILSEIIERLMMAEQAYIASNPGRCNKPCAHKLDMHDCEKCDPHVGFECSPPCSHCIVLGRDTCVCDPAHESDMRKLLQKQLREDIAQDIEQEFEHHESHCIREGRGSCIC